MNLRLHLHANVLAVCCLSACSAPAPATELTGAETSTSEPTETAPMTTATSSTPDTDTDSDSDTDSDTDSDSDSDSGSDSDTDTDGIVPEFGELFTCKAPAPCATTSFSCDVDGCYQSVWDEDVECVHQAFIDGHTNGTIVEIPYRTAQGGEEAADSGVFLILGDGTALHQLQCIGEGECSSGAPGPLHRCRLRAPEWHQACLDGLQPDPASSLDACVFPEAWLEDCDSEEFSVCPEA